MQSTLERELNSFEFDMWIVGNCINFNVLSESTLQTYRLYR